MAEVNKISSFKSFSEIKSQENEAKLREENNLKKKATLTKIEEILDEMGLSSLSELDEDTATKFFSRVLEDEAEEIEDEINDLGKPKKLATKIDEGNAFGDAVRKAKEAGEEEFEFDGKTYKVEEHLDEAIQVEGKRDAKKVVTAYNKIFNKLLVDFGAMSTESILGCIKYLLVEALHDANFHKEAEATGSMIKGSIKPLEIKMPGLGGHFVKIGPKTIKEILDKYYSDIANAASWSGIGIVEGTALYLEQIKQEAMGQAALNKFNSMFEGSEVRIDVESRINEAKGFKNTKDFEAFLKEIDSMPEAQIKKIMGKDYIDTPGFYEDEKDDYEDVIDFMMSNMGREDFNELKDWWESNVQESVVNEAEIKTDEEFKEYAFTVLKKAFGDDFDEAKGEEVVDGILKNSDGDYGAAVGMLTSSLG